MTGGAIDVYYNAGYASDNVYVFVAAARVVVDAATAAATAARGDDNAGGDGDSSLCASPAAATAAPSPLAVGAMPRQRTGSPPSGIVAYFSSS
jgi:hypothetical protein